ncbi:MAG TPA: zf-HC2 domain-containing protein, partial [Candidatus Nanopelagicales bacterium]|nr:zf-HC2 domain-containing protein [Candidatus Nanopelagicales bacterium]
MDCEKFDQHVMDALYDELDELTHAAMKRHMESCARCASTLAGLRATRDAALLPLEEPSDDLEDRILAAVEVAQRKTPWRRKALRALAWAGSHAMRPQLAMAALFVLVIGSSLLLLRARPGTQGVAPVRVTERGVPAPEQPEVALAEPIAAPAAAPAATAAPAAEALALAETAV